jgi:hypothetical protein
MGVSPHSGWAAAVVLGEGAKVPVVLTRSRLELIDGRFPESKQPYHMVESLAIEDAARRLSLYSGQAQELAYSSLRDVTEDLRKRGYSLRSLGILESAGRKGSSLHSILASHALIHSADGDHFRNAMAAAAQRLGLSVSRVPARDLEARAEAALRRRLSDLHNAVGDIGRQVGAPWGADQKKAALLAWLLLEG